MPHHPNHRPDPTPEQFGADPGPVPEPTMSNDPAAGFQPQTPSQPQLPQEHQPQQPPQQQEQSRNPMNYPGGPTHQEQPNLFQVQQPDEPWAPPADPGQFGARVPESQSGGTQGDSRAEAEHQGTTNNEQAPPPAPEPGVRPDFGGLPEDVRDYVQRLEHEMQAARQVAPIGQFVASNPDLMRTIAAYAQTGQMVDAPGQKPQAPPRMIEEPKAPKRPEKPENYDPIEAESNPNSASARYLKAREDYFDSLVDYQEQRAEYDRQQLAIQDQRAQQAQAIARYRRNAQQDLVYRYGLQPHEAEGVLELVSNQDALNDPETAIAAWRAIRDVQARRNPQQHQQAPQQAPQGVPIPQHPNGHQQQHVIPQQAPQQGYYQPQQYPARGYPQSAAQAPAAGGPSQGVPAYDPMNAIDGAIDRFNQGTQLFDPRQMAGDGFNGQFPAYMGAGAPTPSPTKKK